MKPKFKFLILVLLLVMSIVNYASASNKVHFSEEDEASKGKQHRNLMNAAATGHGDVSAVHEALKEDKDKERDEDGKAQTKKALCYPQFLTHDQLTILLYPHEEAMVRTKPARQEFLKDDKGNSVTVYISPLDQKLKVKLGVVIEDTDVTVYCSSNSKGTKIDLRDELDKANQDDHKVIGIFESCLLTSRNIHTLSDKYDAAVIAGYLIYSYPRMYTKDGEILQEDSSFISVLKSTKGKYAGLFKKLFGGDPYYIAFATKAEDLPDIEVATPVKKMFSLSQASSRHESSSKVEEVFKEKNPAEKNQDARNFREIESEAEEKKSSKQVGTFKPISKLNHAQLLRIFSSKEAISLDGESKDGRKYGVEIADETKSRLYQVLLSDPNVEYVARFHKNVDDKPAHNTLATQGYKKIECEYKLQKVNTFLRDSDVKAPKDAKVQQPKDFHLFTVKLYKKD